MDTYKYIHQKTHQVTARPNRLEEIKEYIAGNLKDDLSALSIAKRFELSVSSLQHHFKDYQKQTFHKYVAEIRLNKAMEMIEEGKWIKEAQVATGYKHKSGFNRAFKKKYRHSPGYYSKLFAGNSTYLQNRVPFSGCLQRKYSGALSCEHQPRKMKYRKS